MQPSDDELRRYEIDCMSMYNYYFRHQCKASCVLRPSKGVIYSLAAQAGPNEHNFSLCQAETQL